MPTRRAIAAAVSPWSPLTTRTRMPARWQRATARRRWRAADRASPRTRAGRGRARRRRGRPAPAPAPGASGRGQHAQALRRVAAPPARPAMRARRRRAHAPGRPRRATALHRARSDVGRALDVQHRAVVGAVERRHELAPGVEAEMRDARARAGDRATTSAPRSRAATQEADLGRVAAMAPASSVGRVAAARTRRPARRAVRSRRPPDGRRGRRARHRRPSTVDLHAVLGERAGLVRADDVGRPEGLDRAQALDERAAAREATHADRQRERDRRQQALGDVGDEQPDREDDGVGERQPGERAERDERDARRRRRSTAMSRATRRTSLCSGLSSSPVRWESAAMRPSWVRHARSP